MTSSQYPEEGQYLEETVDFIDQEIARLTQPAPNTAVFRNAVNALKAMNESMLDQYVAARPEPYFARVDFLRSTDGELLEAYIGVRGIFDLDRRYVYDWRAPFPGQVFYADPQGLVTYEAPGGDVQGLIMLKRQYTVSNAQLRGVAEVFRRAPSADGRYELQDSTARFLNTRLGEGRTGELRQVVATLQPDQYQQIAAARSQVMLIQGVAGSGKSVVGLHRIAYLLSPLNTGSGRISESRVMIFGPSRTFLRYIAGLLPSLDVHGVPQATVPDWLASMLTVPVPLDRREPLLEKRLRDRGANWEDADRAARLKGSIQIARAFDAYIQTLRKQFLAAAEQVAVVVQGMPLVLNSTRVRRIAKAVPVNTLNTQRAQVIEAISAALMTEYRKARGSAPGGLSTIELIEAVRTDVSQQVSKFWPNTDFRREYRKLLTDPEALALASGGVISPQDIAALADSLPRRGTVFTPEDLGALCYLDHLVNDHPNQRFEHVMIDEAQEVSVVELLVIRKHSRNDSFTILGDLTQSLSSQGVDRWREILQVFRGVSSSQYVVRLSYRSTNQITRLANRLLKIADRTARTAIPMQRPGPAPAFKPARTYDEMVSAIAADIRVLESREGSVGVLCKSTADARKLHRALEKLGSNVGLLTRDQTPTQRTVIAPIHMTRGLEFNSVILGGASKENYPATSLHTKLLYVGVSRAVDNISIHWVGQPAQQLSLQRSM